MSTKLSQLSNLKGIVGRTADKLGSNTCITGRPAQSPAESKARASGLPGSIGKPPPLRNPAPQVGAQGVASAPRKASGAFLKSMMDSKSSLTLMKGAAQPPIQASVQASTMATPDTAPKTAHESTHETTLANEEPPKLARAPRMDTAASTGSLKEPAESQTRKPSLSKLFGGSSRSSTRTDSDASSRTSVSDSSRKSSFSSMFGGSSRSSSTADSSRKTSMSSLFSSSSRSSTRSESPAGEKTSPKPFFKTNPFTASPLSSRTSTMESTSSTMSDETLVGSTAPSRTSTMEMDEPPPLSPSPTLVETQPEPEPPRAEAEGKGKPLRVFSGLIKKKPTTTEAETPPPPTAKPAVKPPAFKPVKNPNDSKAADIAFQTAVSTTVSTTKFAAPLLYRGAKRALDRNIEQYKADFAPIGNELAAIRDEIAPMVEPVLAPIRGAASAAIEVLSQLEPGEQVPLAHDMLDKTMPGSFPLTTEEREAMAEKTGVPVGPPPPPVDLKAAAEKAKPAETSSEPEVPAKPTGTRARFKEFHSRQVENTARQFKKIGDMPEKMVKAAEQKTTAAKEAVVEKGKDVASDVMFNTVYNVGQELVDGLRYKTGTLDLSVDLKGERPLMPGTFDEEAMKKDLEKTPQDLKADKAYAKQVAKKTAYFAKKADAKANPSMADKVIKSGVDYVVDGAAGLVVKGAKQELRRQGERIMFEAPRVAEAALQSGMEALDKKAQAYLDAMPAEERARIDSLPEPKVPGGWDASFDPEPTQPQAEPQAQPKVQAEPDKRPASKMPGSWD